MKKVIFLIVFSILFLSFFNKVWAGVIINEVQVAGDTKTDEFIELYNTGSSSVDLSDYTIKKKTSNTDAEPTTFISSKYFANKIISSGGYLLLANLNYTGSGVDISWPSSYSLANNNSLILYKSGSSVDQVTWGEIEDGKSYQKTSSSWIVASPTPGSTNASSNSSSNDSSNDNTNDNEENEDVSSNDSLDNSSKKVIPILKMSILASSLAFAGQPTLFDLKVEYGNETYAVGKYFWNFGDGTYMSKEGGFEKIYHTFLYPGEYNVVLDYYKRTGGVEPDLTKEFLIKVIPLTVSISKVGDEKDFFVELTNNSDTKIDISNWYLSGSNKYFLFPKNTIILPKKSIIFSGIVTGFTKVDQYNLKLFSSTNELVFNYNPIVKRIVTTSQKVSKTIYPINNELSLLNNKSISTDGNKDFILTPNNFTEDTLGASSINSNDFLQNNNKSSIYFWIFVFLIIISIFTVYFLRRNREEGKASNADYFEILDE